MGNVVPIIKGIRRPRKQDGNKTKTKTMYDQMLGSKLAQAANRYAASQDVSTAALLRAALTAYLIRKNVIDADCEYTARRLRPTGEPFQHSIK